MRITQIVLQSPKTTYLEVCDNNCKPAFLILNLFSHLIITFEIYKGIRKYIINSEYSQYWTGRIKFSLSYYFNSASNYIK